METKTEAIDVVRKNDLNHLIDQEDIQITVCGESYDNSDIVQWPVDNAGIWCKDCLNLNG